MPKHQVIRDVSQTLLGVLRADLQQARAKGKAYLANPTAEFLRKNAPCLVLYLYDLRTGRPCATLGCQLDYDCR